MIVMATSAKNSCLYGVVAHGALLRIYATKPLIADQVAINYQKADITSRQKSMQDYAIKVCLDSQSITDADHFALRVYGSDEEDIWDMSAITAVFGLSNGMANVT